MQSIASLFYGLENVRNNFFISQIRDVVPVIRTLIKQTRNVLPLEEKLSGESGDSANAAA